MALTATVDLRKATYDLRGKLTFLAVYNTSTQTQALVLQYNVDLEVSFSVITYMQTQTFSKLE